MHPSSIFNSCSGVVVHAVLSSIFQVVLPRMFQVVCWWFVVISSEYPSTCLSVYVPFSSRVFVLSISPRLQPAAPLLSLAAMSSESKKVVHELPLHKPRSNPKQHYCKVVEHQDTRQRENRKRWDVPCRNGVGVAKPRHANSSIAAWTSSGLSSLDSTTRMK